MKLHQLGRLEVVPSKLNLSVTGDMKCQALFCMYFGALTELYLSGACLSPLLTLPQCPEMFQQLT